MQKVKFRLCADKANEINATKTLYIVTLRLSITKRKTQFSNKNDS